MTLEPSNDFNALIQRFVESHGHLQTSNQPWRGFEFESEEHVFRCFPHPIHADQMMLECDIVKLDEAQQRDPALLQLFHQINDSLGISSHWFVLVDSDGQALIVRAQTIESSSAEDLSAELCAAIDKAAALKQVIEASVIVANTSLPGGVQTPPHGRFA